MSSPAARNTALRPSEQRRSGSCRRRHKPRTTPAVYRTSRRCDPRAALPQGLVALLSAGNLDLVGVLSATGDAEEAAEIAASLVKLGATRLIVTGLDLSRRKGALVAIALSGAAIAHVTSSPYLADGLETLTPMALARLLTARAAGGVQEAA